MTDSEADKRHVFRDLRVGLQVIRMFNNLYPNPEVPKPPNALLFYS